MTLCPQAWPMPGSASYSAQIPTTRSPVPWVATKGHLEIRDTEVDVEPGHVELVSDQPGRPVLLETELRISMEGVAQPDQVLTGPVDHASGVCLTVMAFPRSATRPSVRTTRSTDDEVDQPVRDEDRLADRALGQEPRGVLVLPCSGDDGVLGRAGGHLDTATDLAVHLHDDRHLVLDEQGEVGGRPGPVVHALLVAETLHELLGDERADRCEQRSSVSIASSIGSRPPRRAGRHGRRWSGCAASRSRCCTSWPACPPTRRGSRCAPPAGASRRPPQLPPVRPASRSSRWSSVARQTRASHLCVPSGETWARSRPPAGRRTGSSRAAFGAELVVHRARLDEVAQALGHRRAVHDDLPLVQQGLERLVDGEVAAVTHRLDDEPGVEQVQDRVLDPARVLVDGHPTVRLVRRPGPLSSSFGDRKRRKSTDESTKVSRVSVSRVASAPQDGHATCCQVGCIANGVPSTAQSRSSGSRTGRSATGTGT